MKSHLDTNVGQHISDQIDPESEASLARMVTQTQIANQKFPNVKFILFILSSRGMAYDVEGLRQRALLSYPDSVVFFQTSLQKPVGPSAPEEVDLVVDLTGSSERQGFWFGRRVRKMARYAVGRKTGFWRKRLYDRLYDESFPEVPQELLQKERFVQKRVLELAGISLAETGEALPDKGKTYALELPALQRL